MPSIGPKRSITQGKRVVVVGSGATAVTLVPTMSHHTSPPRDATTLTDLHRHRAARRSRLPDYCENSCPLAGPFA
jgi:cation diffusion facilitator CzcD-associated flavoprotein CzcO